MVTSSRKERVAVLGGAGAMGRAAVHDLTASGVAVRLLEADTRGAERVARRYGHGRTRVEGVDAGDAAGLARALRGARALVNCAPYAFNLPAMRAALEAGCHYLDLGGLFHTTRRQLRLDAEFRRERRLAVLGMGSAPGIVNVLARAGVDRLGRVASVRVYNGGVDFTRHRAPLVFGFSPATVLDEMTERPMVFEKGRFRSMAPGAGGEDFAFDVGVQKTHLSLHSEVATLPLSFRAKGIRDCHFKIAYDPALLERMKLLIALGLADRRPGPQGVAPRDVLIDCLRRQPSPPELVDDRDSLVVVLDGRDASGRPLRLRYDVTAGPQRRPPLSAVARDTGFPPAIVARMILEGRIRERGVLPPERCVPVAPFLAALAARGLRTRVAWTREM
jgi:saccharopine dehydrogenase-like NADP-dependent oxidoreductase